MLYHISRNLGLINLKTVNSGHWCIYLKHIISMSIITIVITIRLNLSVMIKKSQFSLTDSTAPKINNISLSQFCMENKREDNTILLQCF